MKKNNWFSVSKEGLQQLQQGKPKWYALRELVQNSFDENISECTVAMKHSGGIAHIAVMDDCPEGFKELSHAYTLFAATDKRSQPYQRGRFNLGEKQVLALASSAQITTTKGTVIFCDNGERKMTRRKIKFGSEVTVVIKMTEAEYGEMYRMAFTFIPNGDVRYTVNGIHVVRPGKYMDFQSSLQTEILDGDTFKRTTRDTVVRLYAPGLVMGQFQEGEVKQGWLYELGLPVCEIDCPYVVDVRQKVPLSTDRDSVPEKYLSAIYAEVLNHTYEDVQPETSSEVWIREACGNQRIETHAVQSVVKKRFGDKVAIANPFDKQSIDEALSNGYRVIQSRELSKDERSVIGAYDIIQSSSKIFPTMTTANYTALDIEKTPAFKRYALFAMKVAQFLLRRTIEVQFVEFKGCVAQYGNGRLTLNVGELGASFFDVPVCADSIDLLVHELAHEYGTHHEKPYQDAITKFAGYLTMKALAEPTFFTNI